MSGNALHIANKATGKPNANPLIKMMEDKKRIVSAIKSGQDLSTLKGIKIVSPL